MFKIEKGAFTLAERKQEKHNHCAYSCKPWLKALRREMDFVFISPLPVSNTMLILAQDIKKAFWGGKKGSGMQTFSHFKIMYH